MRLVNSILVSLLLFLIKFYQLTVSKILPPACRFYPSCSEYSILALKSRGIVKGSLLSMGRILRCHPWSKGGVDMPNK